MRTDVRTTMNLYDFWALCTEGTDPSSPSYATTRRFGREWAEPASGGGITFHVDSGDEIPRTFPAWLEDRAANRRAGTKLLDRDLTRWERTV